MNPAEHPDYKIVMSPGNGMHAVFREFEDNGDLSSLIPTGRFWLVPVAFFAIEYVHDGEQPLSEVYAYTWDEEMGWQSGFNDHSNKNFVTYVSAEEAAELRKNPRCHQNWKITELLALPLKESVGS